MLRWFSSLGQNAELVIVVLGASAFLLCALIYKVLSACWAMAKAELEESDRAQRTRHG